MLMAPDFGEEMNESRYMVALRYATPTEKPLQMEYALRFQHHAIDWNIQYMPADSTDTPAGMWEHLSTAASDVFGRAQLTYSLPEKMKLLGGIEHSLFYYDGDKEHFSNYDINNSSPNYGPTADGRNIKLGPALEWIMKHPVNSTGLFAQFSSGELLSKKLEITASGRYDTTYFAYDDLTAEVPGTKDTMFMHQFSPRLAAVFAFTDEASVKLLAGRAFRSPSPNEMFGANSWTAVSNIHELKPETVDTAEIGFDTSFIKHTVFRFNTYYNKASNQIGYSPKTNLVENMYTLSTGGVEGEILFSYSYFSGFANISYAMRLDEKISAATIQDDAGVETVSISSHPNEVTWAPALTANIGMLYKNDLLNAAIVSHIQGPAKRRDTDLATAANTDLRGKQVDAWVSLDANIFFVFFKQLETGVIVKNMLNSQNLLIKNFDAPYDYRGDERSIMAVAKVLF